MLPDLTSFWLRAIDDPHLVWEAINTCFQAVVATRSTIGYYSDDPILLQLQLPVAVCDCERGSGMLQCGRPWETSLNPRTRVTNI